VTLPKLLEKADYISVHVPKLKDTAGMIDKAAFDQMKDGVMLINCARGGIVNEDELYEALKSGKVAGAALDVFATEPPGDHPCFGFEQVICTPHLGASTKEAQTNVAVAVAEQIIDYLQTGTVRNAVNAPSVAGDVLEKVGPYITVGDKMGLLQAQLACGPIKEIQIEYTGDFKELDMAPVSIAILKGLLTPMVAEMVNFVNAPIMAKDRGIKVLETTSSTSEDFVNLITVKAITAAGTTTVSGTIIGRNDPRIVQIDDFRLELVPEGHILLIYNDDKPGAIGRIGTILGSHDINIGRMQVGQDLAGQSNIVFCQTDTPVPPDVVEELRAAPMVRLVAPLEL
jgi:D-3-phosphoglycerate dehydrogenase